MAYEKPSVKKLEVDVQLKAEPSNRTSCDGGHCVKTRYGQDH